MLHFPSSGSLLGSYKKGTHQKEKKSLSLNRRSPFSFIQCRECAQFSFQLLAFNLTDTSWTGLLTKHFNFQLSNRVLSDSSFSDDDQIYSWNRNRKTMIAMANTNLPGLPAMTTAGTSALCFIAQCRNVHLPGRVKGVSCLAWPGTCWQCSNSYILLLQWGQL